jgi:hypothetical protein
MTLMFFKSKVPPVQKWPLRPNGWLEDGDTEEPFQEYATTVDGELIVSTYVPSEEGKAFTVNFSSPEDFSFNFRLFVGEQFIRHIAREYYPDDSTTRILGLQKSAAAYSPFIFSVNNVAEGIPRSIK